MRLSSGLTILEAVIASSILAVASLVLGSLFVSHSRFYRIEEAVSSSKLQKTLFIKNFTEAAKSASAIDASEAIGGITRESSTSTIVFKVPSINAAGDILTGVFDYITLYREDNNVYLETKADAQSFRKNLKRQLAQNVNNLIFRYDAPSPADAVLINAYLYLQKNSSPIEPITTSVRLRNK